MCIAKFSWVMLYRDKKKALFYIFNCTFSVFATYIFLNLLYHPYLKQIVDSVFATWVLFPAIFMMMAMSFYAYRFYLENQTKELGIFMLSGTKVSRIFNYLFCANGMIFALSLILGLLLGFAILPLVNSYIGKLLHTQLNIFWFSTTALYGTVALIITILFYLAVVATGFIYRHEIKELLGMKKEMRKKDERMLELPKLIYILLLLFPIVASFLWHEPEVSAFLSLLAVFGGFYGFCRYVMPSWLVFIQRRYLYCHPIGLIASAHLHQLLIRVSSVGRIFLLITIFMNTYLVVNCNEVGNSILLRIVYLILVINLCMAIVYQVLSVTRERMLTFRHLHRLGYQKQALRKVQRQEIIGLFGGLLLLLVVYTGTLYMPHLLNGDLSLKFVVGNVAIYTLVLVLSGFCTYYVYQKYMMKGMG